VLISGKVKPEEPRSIEEYLEERVQKLTAEVSRLREDLRQETLRRQEIEASWREAALRLRCITENMLDIITITDTEGRPEYISPSAQSILGHEPHQFLQKPILKIVHPEDRRRLIENFRTGVDHCRWERIEFRCRHQQGHYLWFEIQGHPYRNDEGTIAGISFCGRDITERKRSEELLRASEERYREIFENASDIMYTQSLDGYFLDCNKAGELLTGYSRQEIIGRPMNAILEPNSLQVSQEMIKRKLAQGGTTKYEGEIITKSGKRLPLEISTRLIYEGDTPVAIQGTARDISTRKDFERKLKESEARLRLVTDNMRDLVGHFDTDGIAQYVCPSVKNVLGYETEEVVGTPILQLMHPEDEEPVKSWFFKGLKTGTWEKHELRYRHAGGHYLWFEALGSPVFDDEGNLIGATLGSRDITDRKEAQRKLTEQLEFLQLLIETIPSPIYFKDVDGRYQILNQAFAEYLGVQREDLRGKSVHETFSESQAEVYADKDRELFNQPGIQIFETKFGHGDGSIRDVIFHKASFVNQGQVAGIVGVISDITMLKRAEQALAEEKERLAVTLASIGEGVITANVQGSLIQMNRVAEELTGWRQEEAAGLKLNQVFCLVDPQHDFQALDFTDQILRSDKVVVLNKLHLRRRDGGEIIVSVSGSPIRDQSGESSGVVMVVRDITEAVKLEEELLKASKHESLGVLAGGIAHDFNNLLTVILGNVTLARMWMSEGCEAGHLLAEAEKAVKQARTLTQQLLTFARGGQPVKKTLSLQQLLKDSVGFALSGSNVRADMFVPDELWTVEADAGQLSQVFNNLIINAVQAMPRGGTVKIRAENLSLYTSRGPLVNGGYVMISIADSGIGIPRENQAKIFDPYFTTKHSGSGLGLTTAYSIVKNHDGHIEVESVPDHGTVFRVYLPASTGQASNSVANGEESFSGQGRILIMDDDRQILHTAQKMLQSMGYEAVLAEDGNEALDLYRKALDAGNRFKAVIFDLTVPGGMGGCEAMQHLLAMDREVKAIVSSGFSNDIVLADYERYGFKGIVPKPYTIKELGRALRQVLSE